MNAQWHSLLSHKREPVLQGLKRILFGLSKNGVRVFFSDSNNFRRIFICREPGIRYPPSNTKEIDHFSGNGILTRIFYVR
ncbi:hypothetical protein CDAR_525401 [Caerostris darwini]|uniref:Uncharacterized protein n=1 Tax=Caerostris darwini TaxID=1538125 RepID=A0AAV4RHR8_9ARAC|nr:hypothetical protein CDAR_525401 [Caerostris darwini]